MNGVQLDLNAAQAAVRAGYSPKNARQSGFQLLTNIDIAAEIARRQRERRRQYRLSHERILKEIERIAFFDIRRLFKSDGTMKDPSRLSVAQAAAVLSVDTAERGRDGHTVTIRRLKLHDKLGALVKLGRHVGLFKERPTLEDPAKHRPHSDHRPRKVQVRRRFTACRAGLRKFSKKDAQRKICLAAPVLPIRRIPHREFAMCTDKH
jgi:phage terminase small subunit